MADQLKRWVTGQILEIHYLRLSDWAIESVFTDVRERVLRAVDQGIPRSQ